MWNELLKYTREIVCVSGIALGTVGIGIFTLFKAAQIEARIIDPDRT
jgi:hypothetical protein